MSEFTDRINELLKSVETRQLPNAVKSEWRPGVTFDGGVGEITTRVTTQPVTNWDDELKSWGFDPARFEVVEPVRMSTWEAQTKGGAIRQMWAYKAVIRSRSGVTVDEIEALTKPVKSDRRRPRVRPGGEWTLVVPIGDWQIGKPDGDGLDGTIRRVEASFQAVLDRVQFLRSAGYEIGELLICSLGDLGEGCTGHYEQQTFGVQLDRRDQNKVIRRLARNLIMLLAPEFERVTVAAVGGNHGENRRGSKSFTSTNDNDDVAVFEAIAETLAVRPELYGHITWLLPDDELSVSLKIGDKIIGLCHGHQSRSGDLGKWWQAQSLSGRAVADADLLISGHFHHFRCVEVAKGRWWIQVPAMDGGSKWFEESFGSSSTAGQVTFLLGPSGWRELAIL